jgi:hypothetical protein
MYILRIRAKYFPFVYVLYGFVNGAPITDLIVGIVIGHIYIYFKELLPLSTGKTYLRTPMVM